MKPADSRLVYIPWLGQGKCRRRNSRSWNFWPGTSARARGFYCNVYDSDLPLAGCTLTESSDGNLPKDYSNFGNVYSMVLGRLLSARPDPYDQIARGIVDRGIASRLFLSRSLDSFPGPAKKARYLEDEEFSQPVLRSYGSREANSGVSVIVAPRAGARIPITICKDLSRSKIS